MNISDTIRSQVAKLIRDVQYTTANNVPLNDAYLKQKYNTLHLTSKTLFDLILKEFSKPGFDRLKFDNMLETMITQMEKVRTSELSQNAASENVGKILAKQYIPLYKK